MSNKTKQISYQNTTLAGGDHQKLAVNQLTSTKEYIPKMPENLLRPVEEAYDNYCPQCNIQFDNSTVFTQHNVQVHVQKKIICHLCEATFRRQDHLKRHIQSLHTFHKYCKCPVCGKDYQRNDILMKHIAKNHSDKPAVFKCRECIFQCSTLTDLDNHELTHASVVSRHECLQCKKTFKRRDHMLRHMKTLHLNQVYSCPLCVQMFKRKDHVVRHVREKHQMGLLNGKLVKSSDLL